MTPQSAPRVKITFKDPVLRRTIVTSLLVSTAYYVTAKVGFEFALQPGSVSALWMPNSILLAGLLLTTPRWWWLVIATTLPAHLASELQSGVPTAMVLCWFISNSTQAIIGASLLNYLVGHDLRLSRSTDLIAFLICGTFLAPFLASFLDSALVKLNGWGNSSFWDLWRLRFLSNVLANLILVPAIVEWVHEGFRSIRTASTARYFEAGVLFSVLLVVSFIVFDIHEPLLYSPVQLYWPLPLLVWATIRFGLRGVSTSLFIVMILAIVGASEGTGPFVGNDASYRALSIQAFLIVTAIPLLLLAAVIDERRLAEARNQAILRAIPDAMFLQDHEGTYLDYATRAPEELLVMPDRFLGKKASDVLPPELASRVNEAIARVNAGEEPQVLEYALPINSEERHFEARLVSAQGSRVLSIVRDVTETHQTAESIRQSEARLRHSTRQIRALAAQLITAQESERRRIALLLHDDVGQSIATLGLHISRLKRKPGGLDESMLRELETLTVQVDQLATQIRQLSHEIHPEVLEHVGLIAALKSRMEELEADEQLNIRFMADVVTDPIPHDVAACLYRVALEAMRNVSLHSGVESAEVVLKEIDGSLLLEVSDLGRGFDIEKLRHGSGLGLASSEERVRLLSGTLEIKSRPNAGTCVTARVPLSNPA
ncbi:MAG: hypothetical protein C5B55_11195 [Blastocatellia bacterium]|nr:MAG: hypothetical protein C5B55_11195 [Blastocatellia bacterium]